jgi:hypothetical protein
MKRKDLCITCVGVFASVALVLLMSLSALAD